MLSIELLSHRGHYVDGFSGPSKSEFLELFPFQLHLGHDFDHGEVITLVVPRWIDPGGNGSVCSVEPDSHVNPRIASTRGTQKSFPGHDTCPEARSPSSAHVWYLSSTRDRCVPLASVSSPNLHPLNS